MGVAGCGLWVVGCGLRVVGCGLWVVGWGLRRREGRSSGKTSHWAHGCPRSDSIGTQHHPPQTAANHKPTTWIPTHTHASQCIHPNAPRSRRSRRHQRGSRETGHQGAVRCLREAHEWAASACAPYGWVVGEGGGGWGARAQSVKGPEALTHHPTTATQPHLVRGTQAHDTALRHAAVTHTDTSHTAYTGTHRRTHTL